MSTTKSWDDLVAIARAQNAEKAKAVSNSDTGSLSTTKSWDDLVARARKQNAEKRQKEQQELMQSDAYKWASANAKRLKNGLNLNINNGQIYTFEPLTADVLQNSIDIVDSEIEKLKAQGVSSNRVWNMFTGVANNSEAAQQLRELENQRYVYSKYLQNVEYEDAMAEIDKNGDRDIFSELYSIDSRKKTLLDALGNIGSGGNLLPTDNTEDITRETEIKTELQEKYGDNFNKYRDIYAQGKNDEIKSHIVQQMQETVDEHPVLGTVGYTLSNVATAPMRGIAALSDGINKAAGNYGATSGSIFQEVSDATVQKVNEEINNKFENKHAAGFVRILYNAAVSGAESMLTMGTFGKLGEAVLGLNAATSTYKSAKERGLSDGQALANGIAAGIFETLFEHISLEKVRIFQASPSTSLKPFLQNVLKQAGVEGFEEIGTDLANEAYDYLVNGGLSQYEQALQNGMTAGEYTKQFIAQLGETFFTGALSGGGMIGVSAAPSAVRGSMINLLEDVQQGQQISRFKNLHNDVLSDAKESGSLLRKKAENAEKRIADGKGISYRKLGEINRKVIKKQRESDIDKILSSKDYKELSGKEKNALRSSVLTHLNDAKIVSPEQQDVLNTENAKQILKEMQSLEYRRMEERDSKRIAETEKQSEIKKKTIEEIRTAVTEKNTESLVKNTFTAKHKDGYEVNIGAVKNISDGELEIVQDNETGATAKLSELNIKDSQARELYSNLQTLATGENPLSVEAINVALSMYNTDDNTSARAYALWVHDAYKSGSLNINNTVMTFSEFEEMFHEDYRADIDISQLKEMYDIGARNLVTTPGVTRIGHKGLSKFQAEQVFILDQLGKKYGLDIVLVDGKLYDNDGRAVNALYMAGSNRIVMSLNSDLDLLLVHAGHEIFHYAKNQSAEMTQFLQDTVINLLQSDSQYDYEGIYAQFSEEYKGLSEEDILEEIAAQYMGVVFANENNIRKTVEEATTEQRGFLQKVVDRLKDFIKTLKKLIEIYSSQDKAVKAAVETPKEQLEEMLVRLETALAEAAKNKKSAEQMQGGEKYSYAGIKAKTRDVKALDYAIRLEDVGKATAEEIRLQTGWFRGYDNKWRFEISDRDMEIDTTGKFSSNPDIRRYAELFEKAYVDMSATEAEIEELKTLDKNLEGVSTEPKTLGELIRHDLLFSAYPQLKDMKIHFADIDVRGAYDPMLKELLLQKKLKVDKSKLTKTLVHEIQHAIQDIEGFASGTNLDYWRDIGIPEDKVREYYENTAGEIEARDAAAREWRTDEARKEKRPDIDRSDVVFADNSVESFSIVEPFVDNNGIHFDSAVLLDTTFFDGISTRDWGRELRDYVADRSKNNPFILPIVDEKGNVQQLQFAKINERVTKNGTNHKVINKLSNSRDNISKLAVLHIDEIVSISEEANPYYSNKHTHQWLDEHGWLHRTANVINAKNGQIFNITIDIAKTKDGRIILYATNGKVKKVGNANVNSLKIRGPRPNSNSIGSLSQEKPNVNIKYSKQVRQLEREVKEKYSRQLISETEENISQLKTENESFFQYLERLGDKIGEQIKVKRKPGSEFIYDRTAFYEIARKFNLLDSEAEGRNKLPRYSDTELVNAMENIMVGISDGLISPEAGLSRLARIQEDILRTGYELKYGKDRNGQEIKEKTAKFFNQDIRNKPIYVSRYTYDKLMEQYGTRRNLRAASLHQLSIKEENNDNTPNIEFIYGELLKKYPNLLNEVTEPLDMINELISTERAVHPHVEYISEKEGFKGFLDMSEAAVRRAADMLTEAFNVELIQGDLQAQYKELRSVRETLDRTKKYYSRLLNDAAKIRAEREQKEAELKRVIRITRRLDKMLRKETDYNHIPENLKAPVAQFLQVITKSITNTFGESLIDGSLTMAELYKAYEAYGYEDTMHSDESYAEKLSRLQFVLHGDKRLKDLSLNELETVEEIVTHFNFLVNEGNKTFVDTQKRGYEHIASISAEELFAHRENRKKGLEKIKDAEYHMLTPYYFFKMIGTRFEGAEEVTEILGELGNALLKGEEKTARNTEKVKEITQQIRSKHGYDSRWLSDKKDYVLKSGQKVSMTTENIMHILATYDREKASGFKTDHIFAGGIVVNETTHKTVSDYIIKPIPKAIKTRHAFNKVQKERKERLKNNGEKIFVGMTDSERAKLLKETALPVVDATDVFVKEDVVGQVMELKEEYDGSAFKVVRKLGENYGVFKDYSNENIRLDFNYSVGSIKKSINEAEKNYEDINDFAKMLSVFDDVVKNAQLVEVHEDKYKGTKKENTNLAQVYVLMSAFQDGNNLIPVEFVVKEFKKGVNNQLYVSVNLKRIEAEVPKAVEPKSPDAFRPTSVYRISDIISKVNPFDIEFLKYIPASMLDEQQIVGRNEGIRKERLRVADVARTGEIALKEKSSEDEQKLLADKMAESMRVNISPADVDMFRSKLTLQQTEYYKALVRAMSKDGADMGNETSMMLFGTKKFTEENYCPVSVVSDYLLERFGSKDIGERRLKNRSFTKRITENSNAPILIDNMSEVYAKHMYEMCTYNGMTIPLESIERLLNYKLPDEYEAVGDKIQLKKGKSYRELFREAFGDRALQYLENLMKDLNGGIKVDNRGALNTMISNFKRSAVSASLTVAMQQPGSVGRAMFRINPQNFVYFTFSRYDELLKYCPLAVIKDVGKFDTDVGQSFEDWILDIKPKIHSEKSIKGVAKGLDMWLPDAKGKLEDAMMWLPGYLDRVTWLHIWNAVKRETAHKNGVKVSKLTEKMLTQAGERMSQVIRETQVYDSVLSRSDLMRSKSTLAQMATSFMAEPTVTYNMMRYAAVTAKHQPKVLVRAIASVLCSIVLTDLLKNLAKAVRYDDEETDFAELMISGTVVDFINDLNPLTYIPYVKDIWSMFEGYDIERVDMSVFSKVIDALKPFIDSEKEAGYEEWEQLIVTLSMFTGIPVNNLWKDITGIKAKFKKGSPKFSIDAVVNNIKSELSENPFIKLAGKIFPPIYYFFDMSDEKIIYNAILNDDEAVLDRYRLPSDEDVEDIINKGYSESDAQLKATDNAENNFHSKVVSGLVSEDIRIKEAAEARLESDTKVYEELLKELTELGFDRNDVIKAVDKYIASMEDKTYESSEKKDKATYTYDDLYRAIDSKNMTAAKVIFDSLTEEKKIDTVRDNIKKEYADDIYNAIRKRNNTEKQRLINMFDEFDYDYHYAVILGLQENDNRVKEAAKARYAGKYSLYESKSAEIINDGFSESDVFSAIEKETAKLVPEEDDNTVSSPETNYQYEYADIHRAIDKNDLDGVKYVVAELKESGVKSDNIKSSLNGKYRDKYIKAWQTGDDDTIQRLRTLLSACDVGFSNKTFAAWEKAANENN